MDDHNHHRKVHVAVVHWHMNRVAVEIVALVAFFRCGAYDGRNHMEAVADQVVAPYDDGVRAHVHGRAHARAHARAHDPVRVRVRDRDREPNDCNPLSHQLSA